MQFPCRVTPFRKCGKVLQYFVNINIQGPTDFSYPDYLSPKRTASAYSKPRISEME